MGSELAVDHLVLAGAALLAFGVVVSGLAARLRVPSLLLFLGLGMLVSDDGLELVEYSDVGEAQSIAVVALVVILYDGGLGTPRRGLKAVALPSSVLATAGVVVTASVIALFAWAVLGLDAVSVWLLGAVVASTDAAAVFGVLRGVAVPTRLRRLVEVESGANDPVAVLLTVGLLEVWRGEASVGGWIVFGFVQLAGGFAIGAAVGLAGAWLLQRLRLPSGAAYPVLALGIGGLAYGLATSVGASGFLAVYLAGILVGSGVPRYHRSIASFHEALAGVAQIGLFFLLGILVFPSELDDVAWQALAVAVVLTFLARPIAVAGCLVWFRFRPSWLVFTSWAGLRGAVPIVLATYPLTAGQPDGRLIFNIVFFVVLVSALVQGSTVAWLARRLGLARDDEAPALAEIIPTDTLDADVVRLELTSNSPVVGQPLKTVPLPGDARVAVLVRGGRSLVPTGSTVLEAGDVALIAVPPGQPMGPLERWAATDTRQEGVREA